MSEIAIITCGGTIDKTYGTGKNIYNFEIRDSAIPNLLSLRAYNHTFIHVPLLKKDSLDETTEDRETIRATIEQLPQEYILITHGTDSMIQTAKHLEGIGKKTIVLVGASIPYVMKDSDAEFNIGFALG